MYLKILKRDKQDQSLFFYFDEVVTSDKQRDFFKKYETSLLYDLIPGDTFLNVLLHQGTLDLPTILYHCQYLNIKYAIGLKPGMDFYKDWNTNLKDVLKKIEGEQDVVEYSEQEDKKAWSFMKGSTDHFIVFNPVQNHIFSKGSIESWKTASSENNLVYIEDERLVNLEQLTNSWVEQFPKMPNLKESIDDGHYSFKNIDNYKIKSTVTNPEDTWYETCKTDPELSKQMYSHTAIGAEQRKELFSVKRSKLVIHNIFKDSFKSELENFDEVIELDQFDDFVSYFDNLQFVTDAVYILGGLPSHRRIDKIMNYDQILSFHSRIRSIPNTSVFGKFMDTDQEIFING